MKLVTKVVLIGLLQLLWFGYINTSEYINVFLQKCYGSGNPKYCTFKTVCKPLNRTSKWSSSDVYFNPGVKLEAPIYLEVIANYKFRTIYRRHLLKIKDEICSNLNPNATTHPFFRRLFSVNTNGNAFDPCPLSGHRYVKPQISTYSHLPLVPVGEWRLDFIVTKNVNNTEEHIFSWSDFYEIKPTSATEF